MDDEDSLTPLSPIPAEIAKKIPWWSYLVMGVFGTGTLGSSGYVGSLLGAAQAAQDNADRIDTLEEVIGRFDAREQASKNLVDRVNTMTKTIDRQNSRLERLTLVLATTNRIDINTLVGPQEDP